MFAINLVVAVAAAFAIYVYAHRRGYLFHRAIVERKLQEIGHEARGDGPLERAVRRLRMRLYWSGRRQLLGHPKR